MVVQRITFCSFEKDKISKNLILIKLISFQKERGGGGGKETHFKKRSFKTLSPNYVWTRSSMREVHRQPFQRPSHNHPKRNFISKKKKKIFQNFFKRPSHNHSKSFFFFQRFKFKTFSLG